MHHRPPNIEQDAPWTNLTFRLEHNIYTELMNFEIEVSNIFLTKYYECTIKNTEMEFTNIFLKKDYGINDVGIGPIMKAG